MEIIHGNQSEAQRLHRWLMTTAEGEENKRLKDRLANKERKGYRNEGWKNTQKRERDSELKWVFFFWKLCILYL